VTADDDVRLECTGQPEGEICHSFVNKDKATQMGWTVVLTYNLIDSENATRRLLCRNCTRRHEGMFQHG